MARNKSNSLSSSKKNESGAESVIEELKQKMSRLKFRLLDCQNQNQMLRKELLLAKKVVSTEVSPDSDKSFNDVLHQATSTEYKGRREKILLLRDKLSELQKRIKEIEEGKTVKFYKDTEKIEKVDRLEDQNSQNRQIKGKELQYLLENACQMKRKLEIWKKRNAELVKEKELLRLELDSLLEKSKEDRDVHESYFAIEKELRARQAEKLDKRSKLESERSRNKQLVDEIASLKENLSAMLSKINDDKVLTDALNNQQGYLRDLLEREQMIAESDNCRFQNDLRENQLKHASNCNMLNHLKEVVEEKTLLCQQLQETLKQKVLIDDVEDDQERISTATIPDESDQSRQEEPVPAGDPSAEPNQEEPSEAESEIVKLTDERDQYLNVFRSVKEEIGQLRHILSTNDERLNEWMAQLLQSRSLLAQRNAEIRDLQETIKRLQIPKFSAKKLGETSKQGLSFTEEINKKYDVLNEEYKFLTSLWDLLSTDKENSIFVFTISIDSITKLFADAIDDLIILEDTSEFEEQELQEGSERPAEETNPSDK